MKNFALIVSLFTAMAISAGIVNTLLPTQAFGDARLEQQIEAMAREAMQREQRLAALQRELGELRASAQATRCFSNEGGTWRLAVGGSRIDIGETMITVSSGGGGELGVDPSGARLFGPLVQLGGANGAPAAQLGSKTSLGGTVVKGSNNVFVK